MSGGIGWQANPTSRLAIVTSRHGKRQWFGRCVCERTDAARRRKHDSAVKFAGIPADTALANTSRFEVQAAPSLTTMVQAAHQREAPAREMAIAAHAGAMARRIEYENEDDDEDEEAAHQPDAQAREMPAVMRALAGASG
ncbi:MAG: hypothetical protein HYS13_05430 [Planctomycetia bacterium]|nr:hypothetical protein [Planctomycetia bacterium]